MQYNKFVLWLQSAHAIPMVMSLTDMTVEHTGNNVNLPVHLHSSVHPSVMYSVVYCVLTCTCEQGRGCVGISGEAAEPAALQDGAVSEQCTAAGTHQKGFFPSLTTQNIHALRLCTRTCAVDCQ